MLPPPVDSGVCVHSPGIRSREGFLVAHLADRVEVEGSGLAKSFEGLDDPALVVKHAITEEERADCGSVFAIGLQRESYYR